MMNKLDYLRMERPIYGSTKRSSSSFPRFTYLCVIKETKDKTRTLSSLQDVVMVIGNNHGWFGLPVCRL